MTNLRIIYTGNVQGVGFRYTVKQVAAGYEVVGWVRNLDDGSVELQASGEEAEVEAFLEGIARGQLARHIKQVQRTELDGADTPTGFEIRR